MKLRTVKNQHRTSGSSQRHLLRMLFLTLLVVLTSSCTGKQQPSPDGLVFAGLEHKDLGGADVDLELVVDGIGTSGQDGLATNVEPAQKWEADISLAGFAPGGTITYTALTDRPVSTMVWEEEDGAVEISASFERSSTYSLEISNGGTTVLTRSGIPNGVSAVRVLGNDNEPEFIDFCDDICSLCCLELTIAFGILQLDGLLDGDCFFESGYNASVQMDAGEGIVFGDRILLTEEHESEDAHDAMVFTEMRIQASGLSSIRIRDERVERPR